MMKNKLLFKISVLGSVISFILVILSLYGQVEAFNMSNDNYEIKGGNFNSFSGKASGGGKTVTFTSGETAIGESSSPKYKVKSGFQYIYSNAAFGFSISSLLIDFGTLRAGEPISRTNTLRMNPGSAPGFQVTVLENSELKASASGQIIPDTTCDTGSCTDTTAGLWTSPLTYGFGYRCDNRIGESCSSEFDDEDYFKQFPNKAKSEKANDIMVGIGKGAKSSQVTYKVNIPATQPAGYYQNIIIYIASPTI